VWRCGEAILLVRHLLDRRARHAVDVADVVDVKKAAMAAHRSQIGPDSFFFKMPEAVFAAAFGTEWFIALESSRAEGEPFGTSLFA
jgi:LmbE family N-acetylglucosaminyl deacetylase